MAAPIPRIQQYQDWLQAERGLPAPAAPISGTLPLIKGEMQCRCLGAAVEAFSEDGQPLMNEVGELVCTQPMPSMPLYFPRTLSGKKMELPVKKLLMGAAPESVFNRDAMANADCIAWFSALARSRAQS